MFFLIIPCDIIDIPVLVIAIFDLSFASESGGRDWLGICVGRGYYLNSSTR